MTHVSTKGKGRPPTDPEAGEVRNTSMGGQDFFRGEYLIYADLNVTFDELYETIQGTE